MRTPPENFRNRLFRLCYHHAMRRGVAVVIPALNEEEEVGAAIESARRAGAREIVVADGGSSDDTTEVAERSGARVVRSGRVRGERLNEGAASTSGDILLFLHADTTLPEDAVESVEREVADGSIFGGFRLRFRERRAKLRVAETMINLRCRFTKCPWGDQAQWVTRNELLSTGGFRQDPIMEDYEMATRMKTRGRVSIIPTPVTTSGRRFLDDGVIRTAFTNWKIILLWRLGTPPDELAAIYRSSGRDYGE